MKPKRAVAISVSTVALVLTVAGCTSNSDGTVTTPVATATQTVTATGSASSPSLPTGSGVPASSTAPAGGGSGGSSGSSGSASGPGLCTPTVMTFRVGRADGAAGTTYIPIIATNASQQPCVTTGYPGVAALNGAGTQIAQATRYKGGTGGTTIVVQPGQQISARLGAATMAEGVPECPVAPAILFTLPDNTDSTRLVVDVPACTNGIGVGPFVRGTTGGL